MNAIRNLFSLCAMSALLAAQTSTSPSSTTTPTTRPRSQTATTPTTNSPSTAGSRVTLPSGTPIEVRVNESLSSETTQQGERFTGTVTSDVTDPLVPGLETLQPTLHQALDLLRPLDKAVRFDRVDDRQSRLTRERIPSVGAP